MTVASGEPRHLTYSLLPSSFVFGSDLVSPAPLLNQSYSDSELIFARRVAKDDLEGVGRFDGGYSGILVLELMTPD